MQFHFLENLLDLSCDTMVLALADEFPSFLAPLDDLWGKRISEAHQRLKYYPKDSLLLLGKEDTGIKRIFLAKIDVQDPFELIRAYSSLGRETRLKELGPKISLVLTGKLAFAEELEIALEGFAQGAYLFELHKTKGGRIPLETVGVYLPQGEYANDVLRKAQVVANSQSFVRDLVNESASVVTPSFLVEEAQRIAQETGSSLEVLDLEACKKLGMGAFSAVASGSDQPAFMVRLEHKGAERKEHLAFVGKGLTFDSGGLSLKQWQSMSTMKSDMAGAAAALGAFRALSLLRPELELSIVCPLTENMPSGKACKPGDILRALNGKTIEVLSTDAEGRLILADALAWAQNKGATHLIDIATLTGACVVALGYETSGLFTNSPSWGEKTKECAFRSKERVWELPMFPEYDELIHSEIADMANSAGQSGASAGAIFAAVFLREFISEGNQWVHLDIAGPAWLPRESRRMANGATGAMVRTLIEVGLAF